MRDAFPSPAPIIFPLGGRRVWVAGHTGLVGSALLRRLATEGCEIVVAPRSELDLTRQAEVEGWVERVHPEAVFVAGGKVGGIAANDSQPADFLYDNLMIQANIVEAARRAGAAKVMLLGSSCIYPRLAPQPIAEDALLTGPLEATNQWYAISKIAALRLGQAYRRQFGFDVVSAMPTNLYGPGDNYDPASSHVLPAMIRKACEAAQRCEPSIALWGSGEARREFLHADDCADALVFLMKRWSSEEPVNVGSGEEVSIAELAEMIAQSAGFSGAILCDRSRPDGTPRKLLDCSRLLALGWRPRIPLADGIAEAVRRFAAGLEDSCLAA
ncbi:MAG: GDP-L-fucose synthase family protein [Caulobacteraceae bacterium]